MDIMTVAEKELKATLSLMASEFLQSIVELELSESIGVVRVEWQQRTKNPNGIVQTQRFDVCCDLRKQK